MNILAIHSVAFQFVSKQVNYYIQTDAVYLMFRIVIGILCVMFLAAAPGGLVAQEKKCAVFDAKWFNAINAAHEQLRQCQTNSQPKTTVLYHGCHGENRTTAYPACHELDVSLCNRRKKRNRETKSCYDRSFTNPTDDVEAANMKLKKQLERTRRFSDPTKNIADMFRESPEAVREFQKADGGLNREKVDLLYSYVNQMAKNGIKASTRDRLIRAIQLNAFEEADQYHRQLLELFNEASQDLASSSEHFKRRIASLEAQWNAKKPQETSIPTESKPGEFTYAYCVKAMPEAVLQARGYPMTIHVIRHDCKWMTDKYKTLASAYDACIAGDWIARENQGYCSRMFK
ncbi:MAG: hypothetical protein ABJO09_00780 [Hyphomicrobiales bacterium]